MRKETRNNDKKKVGFMERLLDNAKLKLSHKRLRYQARWATRAEKLDYFERLFEQQGFTKIVNQHDRRRGKDLHIFTKILTVVMLQIGIFDTDSKNEEVEEIVHKIIERSRDIENKGIPAAHTEYEGINLSISSFKSGSYFVTIIKYRTRQSYFVKIEKK